jgi:hypothetical protein
MMIEALGSLPQIVTAIGGLGTAAFGLVDASKAFGGSVNHFGFNGIRRTFETLTGPAVSDSASGAARPSNALSQEKMVATLRANWFNGTDLGNQKAIAKSLVKLSLSPANAETLAKTTGVDPSGLSSVAARIASGVSLTPEQSDLYGRFDLIVTALLDEAYLRGDHAYRNGARAVAMITAVLLAIAGAWMLRNSFQLTGQEYAEAVIVGLLATPVAPIAKDLATALASAVNALQTVKG